MKHLVSIEIKSNAAFSLSPSPSFMPDTISDSQLGGDHVAKTQFALDSNITDSFTFIHDEENEELRIIGTILVYLLFDGSYYNPDFECQEIIVTIDGIKVDPVITSSFDCTGLFANIKEPA